MSIDYALRSQVRVPSILITVLSQKLAYCAVLIWVKSVLRGHVQYTLVYKRSLYNVICNILCGRSKLSVIILAPYYTKLRNKAGCYRVYSPTRSNWLI